MDGISLSELSEAERQDALKRYQKLRAHLEENRPLTQVAQEANLPLRTAQRWVSSLPATRACRTQSARVAHKPGPPDNVQKPPPHNLQSHTCQRYDYLA